MRKGFQTWQRNFEVAYESVFRSQRLKVHESQILERSKCKTQRKAAKSRIPQLDIRKKTQLRYFQKYKAQKIQETERYKYSDFSVPSLLEVLFLASEADTLDPDG